MSTPSLPEPADKSPDRISPTKSIESTVQPRSTQFQSYMQQPASGTLGQTPMPSSAATPMNLAQKPISPMATPTFNSLIGQAKSAQDTLGQVEKQLGTDNLKFKRSQAHLVRNKLTDANTYLRAASSKLGVDLPTSTPSVGTSVIGRLIGYVGNGQEQLFAIQEKLNQMSTSGQPISPPDMLTVQIKLSQAQQEIEYCATLVYKVVDSLKTMLNIQL